jgi:hypothetical protein
MAVMAALEEYSYLKLKQSADHVPRPTALAPGQRSSIQCTRVIEAFEAGDRSARRVAWIERLAPSDVRISNADRSASYVVPWADVCYVVVDVPRKEK